VVEARLTISVKYCLWVPVFHFRPKLMYPAARSLCDSWASCYFDYSERYFRAIQCCQCQAIWVSKRMHQYRTTKNI